MESSYYNQVALGYGVQEGTFMDKMVACILCKKASIAAMSHSTGCLMVIEEDYGLKGGGLSLGWMEWLHKEWRI